jgi:excisionase family DNA binding protein
MLNEQGSGVPSTEGMLPQVVPSQPMNHTTPLAEASSEFLSVRDVSRLLGVATVSVYRLAERRVLPVYRLLRKVLFRRREVLDWIESKRTAPRDPSVWPSER